MRAVLTCLAVVFSLVSSVSAYGFGGLYVAKAGSDVHNRAAKVVIVRDEDRTVLTLASDFRGDSQTFAVMVPVPAASPLERKQIRLGEPEIVERLDAYTSPRLVEYFDTNPCQPQKSLRQRRESPSGDQPVRRDGDKDRVVGVHVEGQYAVGDYDIAVLSAKESKDLLNWLKKNGYHVPKGAKPALARAIADQKKFFVAKVNLQRQSAQGAQFLRPLQVAFESKTLTLPIQLGTVNAAGEQDLFVYALTRRGRMEVSNYEMQKLPTGNQIPVFVKDDFAHFYTDMFKTLVAKEGLQRVYTEYAWDASWCDPCVVEPLTYSEWRSLGVFWVRKSPPAKPEEGKQHSVFVTRLHARYLPKTFPHDLEFKVTDDRNLYQARYVIRHPFSGEAECPRMETYQKELAASLEKQASELARLTGWSVSDVRKKMALNQEPEASVNWIDNLWPN